VLPILMRQLRCQGVFVGSRHTFEALCRAIAANPFDPVIDSTLPFADAPRAFEVFAAARHFGKVTLLS
jgi:NADPH:quinone reductase-like Zn-dependent oxidoreductase